MVQWWRETKNQKASNRFFLSLIRNRASEVQTIKKTKSLKINKFLWINLLDTFQMCTQYLPLSVTDSHCFDLTCNTANERARIPSLDQSQCLITVLSLSKVGYKTGDKMISTSSDVKLWRGKLTLSDCTSSLLCLVTAGCLLAGDHFVC